MAPQKSSLYKRTMQSSPRTESINDNSSEDPSEIEFEQQILWCIKKLELMRESEKLNQKKLQEAIKGIDNSL